MKACENLNDIIVYHYEEISIYKSLLIYFIMFCLAELYPERSVNNNRANT